MTRLSVPSLPSSAAVVRRRITEDLKHASISGDLIDDVILVATELLSNALRHAQNLADGDLVVAWEVDAETVRITVTDGGSSRLPRMRNADPRETNGRGLRIVDTLAAEWGVEENERSTSVWATLSM